MWETLQSVEDGQEHFKNYCKVLADLFENYFTWKDFRLPPDAFYLVSHSNRVLFGLLLHVLY